MKTGSQTFADGVFTRSRRSVISFADIEVDPTVKLQIEIYYR